MKSNEWYKTLPKEKFILGTTMAYSIYNGASYLKGWKPDQWNSFCIIKTRGQLNFYVNSILGKLKQVLRFLCKAS